MINPRICRATFAITMAIVLSAVPTTSLAGPGGDGARPSGSTSESSSGGANLHYIPAEGTMGRGPDPDFWDFATRSGRIYGTMNMRGTRDTPPPGIEGECEATDAILTTPELELPAMWIGTTPSPPRDDGLGGVVNVDTWFWVEGYDGGRASGPVVSGTVFNCVVDRTDPEAPRWRRVEGETHTLQVGYRASGVPTWYWGDNMPSLSGWGARNSATVPHTYQVSSGRCNLSTCLDVPGKGPSYVIQFDLNLSLELITDGAPAAVPFPTSRHRAFPVREVQSILER